VTGFEPATPWSQTRWHDSKNATKQGGYIKQQQALPPKLPKANETGPQPILEEHGKKNRKTKRLTVSGDADDGPSAPTNFAAAVAGIFALPLTDAEKAEAVRRLLATQDKKGV